MYMQKLSIFLFFKAIQNEGDKNVCIVQHILLQMNKR